MLNYWYFETPRTYWEVSDLYGNLCDDLCEELKEEDCLIKTGQEMLFHLIRINTVYI